jgi:hypothetical protein
VSKKYFKCEGTVIIFDSNSFKLYMSIGDELLEILDDNLRDKIRFHAQEISPDEAISLKTLP